MVAIESYGARALQMRGTTRPQEREREVHNAGQSSVAVLGGPVLAPGRLLLPRTQQRGGGEIVTNSLFLASHDNYMVMVTTQTPLDP